MTIGEFSIGISIVGGIPYARSIIRGSVRPERMSWFIWSVILGLGLWGYRASGGDDSAWFIVGDLIITASIFFLSLWHGTGGWNRLDATCLVVAFAGIILWQLTSIPVLGVVGVVTADIVALIPTLIKALRKPMTESTTTFAFTALAAACGTVAVGKWDVVLLAYPVYLFLANFTTAIVIFTGQYQLRLRRGSMPIPVQAYELSKVVSKPAKDTYIFKQGLSPS